MPTITAVMIDSREPAHIQQLKFGGVPTMVAALETGDVQAITDDNCTLVFERKTLSDFLNTLADERLFVQLARMVEPRNTNPCYWPYLIITDPIACDAYGKVIVPERGVTGWPHAAVQGAILSIQELGVHVTWCNGAHDYEDCILRIGKRNRSPVMHIAAPRTAKTLGPKFDFLAGIKGIDVANGQKILDWCDNNLAHALIGLVDLEIPAPIPFATRKRLRDLLGLQDGEKFELTGTQLTEPIAEGQK
jgi:ERCC4-type nuclease